MARIYTDLRRETYEESDEEVRATDRGDKLVALFAYFVVQLFVIFRVIRAIRGSRLRLRAVLAAWWLLADLAMK